MSEYPVTAAFLDEFTKERDEGTGMTMGWRIPKNLREELRHIINRLLPHRNNPIDLKTGYKIERIFDNDSGKLVLLSMLDTLWFCIGSELHDQSMIRSADSIRCLHWLNCANWKAQFKPLADIVIQFAQTVVVPEIYDAYKQCKTQIEKIFSLQHYSGEWLSGANYRRLEIFRPKDWYGCCYRNIYLYISFMRREDCQCICPLLKDKIKELDDLIAMRRRELDERLTMLLARLEDSNSDKNYKCYCKLIKLRLNTLWFLSKEQLQEQLPVVIERFIPHLRQIVRRGNAKLVSHSIKTINCLLSFYELTEFKINNPEIIMQLQQIGEEISHFKKRYRYIILTCISSLACVAGIASMPIGSIRGNILIGMLLPLIPVIVAGILIYNFSFRIDEDLDNNSLPEDFDKMLDNFRCKQLVTQDTATTEDKHEKCVRHEEEESDHTDSSTYEPPSDYSLFSECDYQ